MNRFYLLAITFALLLFSGCGPRRFPVSGQVVFDDKSAENIIVMFEPQGEARIMPEAGTAITNSQGEFVLQGISSKANGIQAGQYKLFLGWKDPNAESDPDPAGGTSTKETRCPYQLPKSINDGKFIVTVPKGGLPQMKIKVTKENVEW